jgi:lipid-A-disaccharide synthase-like uncharacterized protein
MKTALEMDRNNRVDNKNHIKISIFWISVSLLMIIRYVLKNDIIGIISFGIPLLIFLINLKYKFINRFIEKIRKGNK